MLQEAPRSRALRLDDLFGVLHDRGTCSTKLFSMASNDTFGSSLLQRDQAHLLPGQGFRVEGALDERPVHGLDIVNIDARALDPVQIRNDVVHLFQQS